MQWRVAPGGCAVGEAYQSQAALSDKEKLRLRVLLLVRMLSAAKVAEADT